MLAKRILSALLFIVFAFAFPGAFSEENAGVFEVHFLSVGSNDGILLRAGDECAFIDSGNLPEGRFCVDYMKDAGVERLKYYIGTHAHRDHVGGAPVILTEIPTEAIIYTYDMVLYAINSVAYSIGMTEGVLEDIQKYPAKQGDVFTLGGATLTCVGPDSYIRKNDFRDNSENNNSLLLHVTYGDVSFFLTGDSPSWQVLKMNKIYPEVLKSHVIKAPHHKGGFDKSVYDLIDCRYFVFSTADDALPQKDQMDMALMSSACVLITADNRNGHIVFTTDGKTLSVKTQFDYDYTAK